MQPQPSAVHGRGVKVNSANEGTFLRADDSRNEASKTRGSPRKSVDDSSLVDPEECTGDGQRADVCIKLDAI